MRDDFVVKVARNRDDAVRVAEFIEGIFGHGRDYILGHPDVQFAGSVRYVEHRGAVVSAHVLEHIELALGKGYAKAMRVECVGTHKSFRGRGLCRMLMDHSLQYLKDNGIQIAAIFGEPLFRKLGFEYCVPTYAQEMPIYSPPGSHIIPAAALARFTDSREVDPLEPGDIPAIGRLHQRDNPQGNLSRRRSMTYWTFLVSDRGIQTYRIVRSGKSVAAYLRVESSPAGVRVREIVAATPDICACLLHQVYEIAQSEKAVTITFHCPHRGTFGHFVRMHGAAAYSPFAERATALQLRILDLTGCLRLLQDTLSTRLKHSELARATGRYRLTTDDDEATVEIRKG